MFDKYGRWEELTKKVDQEIEEHGVSESWDEMQEVAEELTSEIDKVFNAFEELSGLITKFEWEVLDMIKLRIDGRLKGGKRV